MKTRVCLKYFDMFVDLRFGYPLHIIRLFYATCVKPNLKHLEIDEYVIHIFQLQRYLVFLKY